MTTPKPVVLCILDGWGIREADDANASTLANTPNFDAILRDCPSSQLITHGPDVGLPTGQMGNSEVGHTNIGAGRVVPMDLGMIDLAIEDGTFNQNPALQEFINNVKAAKGTAHLMALVSDGGVHGHINHVIAAAKAMTDAGLPVVIHAITDGRDVPPQSAAAFITDLVKRLPKGANVATVIGRYYALDRDNRWERVGLAYDAMINGKGLAAATATDAVAQSYAGDVTDEFIKPTSIADYSGVQDGDGIFCLNFRADRAREILAAIGQPDFDGFEMGPRPTLSALLGMVQYSDAHNVYMTTVFPKSALVNTLGEWVAKQGLRQFRLAETEKYPHVTFFLNGGKETPEIGEDRYMAQSPKVATYDLQPEMSAAEVAEHFVGAIEDGYDLIVTNFANPDMVGHTGNIPAAVKACEAVDQDLGLVLAALKSAGGAMIVTADHGNCETMIDPETGGPHTAHTINPVPVILVGAPDGTTLHQGRLSDLAPTLLDLMNLPLPDEMTGESLINK